MKTYIVIISLMLVFFLINCGSEPVSQSQKEYNLDEILSDSNWVEITDTVDVTDQIKCLAQQLIKNKGIVFQSENDYKELWETSVTEYPDWVINCYGLNEYDSMKVNYESPDIDFNERTVLFHSVTTTPAKYSRFIFKNNKSKEVLYLIHIELISYNERASAYYQWVSIPKISTDYNIIFDTTLTDNRR